MQRAPRVLAVIALAGLVLMGCRSNDEAEPLGSGPTAFVGRARVTGTLTGFEAEAAATEDIAAPFVLAVVETGRGGLTMPAALVAGKEQSIVWTGGRPLPVSGECRLVAGEVAVRVEAVTARFALDGATRAMSGPSCTLGSSVAVGQAGLSKPVPSVTFAAPGEAVFTTTGGVSITVPAVRRYEGRAGKLTLVGDFIVERDNLDAAKATRVEGLTGTWVVEIKGGADAGTLRVVATLEGSIRRS